MILNIHDKRFWADYINYIYIIAISEKGLLYKRYDLFLLRKVYMKIQFFILIIKGIY